MLFVLSSHSSVFAYPLAPDEAMNDVEALICLPHIRVFSEEEGFLEIYREIARDVPARGIMVPGIHLAALLRQHGVKSLYTNDRDFRKFDFLKVRNLFVNR